MSPTPIPPPGSDAVGESLIALAPEQFGSLLPFVPDTPWTTTTIHVLQRKQGKVFVDSAIGPRNLIVIAAGEPATRTPDRAFLFGAATADAIREFVKSLKAPTEIVCDEDVAELVREYHTDAKMHESIVHWYDRIEDAQAARVEPGAKRLRISDSDNIAALVPGTDLRTFRTVRDLVTGGSAFIIDDQGQAVAAAYTVDHSVKFERFAVCTREDHRREGLGTLVGRRLIKCIADQARMPCAVVDRTDEAGLALAAQLGFTQKAQMTTFTTRMKPG